MLRRGGVILLLGMLGSAKLACATTETVSEGYEELAGGGGPGGAGSSDGGASSSSKAASSASSSGGPATGTGTGGASSSSTAGGAPCADDGPGEPNETEAQAYELAMIDDCDGSGSNLMGKLTDSDDVDWFKYKGDDSFGCTVDPSRDVSSSGTVRFCKFLQCDSGNPTFQCPGGTTPEVSPDGRSGCCGGDGFTLDLDCSGSDDNAWVYMRLDQPNPACGSYTLAWHF